jgi:glycosyltransferase involved in cell wall biosynthesis
MSSPLKISFVWDWPPDFDQTINWKDGLAAALKVLIDRGHEVTLYTDTDKVIPHDYFTIHPIDMDAMKGSDVILQWGDQTRPHALPLAKLGIPTAICFAGGEPLGENVELFNHIFVESEVYKKVYDEKGYSCSVAFGTNTELFKPMQQNKVFLSIFPATFALWKRHELFAQAMRDTHSLACGYIYTKHETECWQVCLDNGLTVLPHVSSAVLHYLYAASKVCVIPSLSSGGSQRTVLEAMAMNLPLVVCDSDKFDYVEGQDVLRVEPTVMAIREAVIKMSTKEVNTRDYVLENWSEFTYADALEEGLRKICNA